MNKCLFLILSTVCLSILGLNKSDIHREKGRVLGQIYMKYSQSLVKQLDKILTKKSISSEDRRLVNKSLIEIGYFFVDAIQHLDSIVKNAEKNEAEKLNKIKEKLGSKGGLIEVLGNFSRLFETFSSDIEKLNIDNVVESLTAKSNIDNLLEAIKRTL